MKKIFGIALVLAVAATLCFGGVALAAEPPDVTIDWDVDNPDSNVDINVSSHLVDLGVGPEHFAVAWFDLKGTGPSNGSVTASGNSRDGLDAEFAASGSEVHVGAQNWFGDLPLGSGRSSTTSSVQFDLEGHSTFSGHADVHTTTCHLLYLNAEYTGSGGNFESSFTANYWGNMPSSKTLPVRAFHYHSSQSIQATGVTDGSLYVAGSAHTNAIDGKKYSLGAGQEFNGKAASATIDAITFQNYYSNYDHSGYDEFAWDNPTSTQFGSFHAEITAGSTCQFAGRTAGRGYGSDKQGLGFEVYTIGADINSDVNSNYAYNVIRGFVEPDAEYSHATAGVFGESATWSIEVDGKTYPAYPGYFEPPEPE